MNRKSQLALLKTLYAIASAIPYSQDVWDAIDKLNKALSEEFLDEWQAELRKAIGKPPERKSADDVLREGLAKSDLRDKPK